MNQVEQEFKLKSITLANKLTILREGKPIFTAFDFILAAGAMYFISSAKTRFKAWTRTLKSRKDIRVIYGATNTLEEVMLRVKDTEFFKTHSTNGMFCIDQNLPDGRVLWYLDFMYAINECLCWVLKEYIKDKITTQEQLNKELEAILEYGLYDDKSFSEMTEYYSKIIFNINTTWKKLDTLKIGDKIVQLSVDDGDDIPDELIEYAESEYWKRFWWDEQKEWVSFWEVCKKLRKVIKYEPWDRQRYAIVMQKRFTWIVCSRKYGKSYWLAYIAIRQLFLHNQDIVYVVPDFTMADQVYFYIERFIRDTWDSALRFDKARRQVSYTTTRSNIVFVSWESKYVGRSRKADLLLYDEASFLQDITMKTLRPLIANTEWYQISVSTPSPISPINWFYFWFKKWELWTMKETFLSIRRDIYHNKWISETERNDLIDTYKNDPIMSQSELLAMFPIGAGAFNLVDFFIHHTDFKKNVINGIPIKIKAAAEILKREYHTFVIGYDPAMLKDKWWFCLFGVKWVIESETRGDKTVHFTKNMFEIICSAYINVLDYAHQIDFILTMQDVLCDAKHPMYIWMDYTGSGMWVYELMQSKGVRNIQRIMRTGNNQKGEPFYENGFRRCQKVDLESFFRAAMGVNLFAYNFLEELRWEIETYGTQQRSAGDAHFDQLSAAFVAFFVCKRYIGEYIWQGNKIIKDPDELYEKVRFVQDLGGMSDKLWGWWISNVASYRSRHFVY